MHDVAKRGLALAVATGGLLISGAAPAVSAVHHPEHPGRRRNEQPADDGSSHHAAGIPVNGSQVKQYVGRHKAPDRTAGKTADKPAAAAHPTAAAHHPAGHHHPAAPHQAAAHHADTAHHHPSAAPHHGAPHHPAAPHHGGTPHHGAPATHPATGAMPQPHYPAHGAYGAHGADSAGGAQAEASDLGGGGLLAGNTIEVPVDAPVNFCGVVATVLGGGDQAAGEHCFNGPDVAGGPNSSAAAVAAGNPGALSDNVVQVPVSLPANICGDTVTVAGGHDSAEDIFCANEGGPSFSTAKAVAAELARPGERQRRPGAGGRPAEPVRHHRERGRRLRHGRRHQVCQRRGPATSRCGSRAHTAGCRWPSVGAGANAVTANSPGAVSGNILQVPIEAPINACGDTVSVVGAFNSALDNHCVNDTAGGAAAKGTAVGNNGLATGNVAQLPIDIPTEVCGVVAGVGATTTRPPATAARTPAPRRRCRAPTPPARPAS